MGLGWQELLIILAVALLLFGGSRLAGIGKASGRAIREFKEETRDLHTNKPNAVEEGRTEAPVDQVMDTNTARGASVTRDDRVMDAELVEDDTLRRPDQR